VEAGGLERITLHECRHTAASLYIAAGVKCEGPFDVPRAQLNHRDDRPLWDLMPGSEEEAAGLLDSYLTAERKRAEEKARKAGGELTGAQSGAQGVEIAATSHEQAT
jgi:hypothetical protein